MTTASRSPAQNATGTERRRAAVGWRLRFGFLSLIWGFSFLLPLFTSLTGGFPVLSLLAIVALGTLGTGFAMLIQCGIVSEVGPTTAQMVTYFIPVIATAADVAILGKSLTWSQPADAAIVLAGAALTQVRPRTSAERTTAASATIR